MFGEINPLNITSFNNARDLFNWRNINKKKQCDHTFVIFIYRRRTTTPLSEAARAALPDVAGRLSEGGSSVQVFASEGTSRRRTRLRPAVARKVLRS